MRKSSPVFSKREAKPQTGYSAPPQEKQKMKLKFVRPEQFDEAAEIADSLRARQAVLMNLEMTETDTARRLLDFLSGAAYALGGRVMRVSAQAYIIAPTNVDLVGRRFRERGTVFLTGTERWILRYDYSAGDP